MRPALKTWMIISNVLWSFAFVASLLPLVFSVMLFDAPGSENSLLLQMAFLAILFFPLSTIISIIGAGINYKKEREKATIFFMTLPLLDIVLIVLIFVSLDVFCGGKLACGR